MNNSNHLTVSLLFLALSCGQIAAHDPRCFQDKNIKSQDLSWESKQSLAPTDFPDENWGPGEDLFAAQGCLVEVPAAAPEAPELPEDILEMLYKKLGVPPEMGMLPQELIGLMYHLQPEDAEVITQELIGSAHIVLEDKKGREVENKTLTLSPDGETIVGWFNNQHHLFNRDGSYRSKLSWFNTCGSIPPVLSPDGKIIAVISSGARCCLLFNNKGKKHGNSGLLSNGFLKLAQDYQWVAFSPAGQTILASRRSSVHLFDAQGLFRATLQDEQDNNVVVQRLNNSFQFSPGCETFLLQDDTGQAHLFDIQGTHLATLKDEQGNNIICHPFFQCKYSPYGKLISIKDTNDSIHLFTTRGVRIKLEDKGGTSITCREIRFMPRGLLCARDANRQYHYFKLKDFFKKEDTRLSALGSAKSRLFFSTLNPCHRIARINKHGHSVTYTHENKAVRLKLGTKKNGYLVCSNLIFSPDEQILVAQHPSGSRFIFTSEGDFIKRLESKEGDLWACREIEFSPDGRLIKAINTGGAVHLFDLRGNILRLIDKEGNDIICAELTFSSNEKIMTTKDFNDREYLFDVDKLCYLEMMPRQLIRGLSFDQFLMLRLLVSIKKNWQQDLPQTVFSISPADITNAIIHPLLTEESFKTEESRAATLRRFEQVHNWVVFTLNSLRNIWLTPSRSLYDALNDNFNFTPDLLIQGLSGKAKPCVAAFLHCSKSFKKQKKENCVIS